MNYISTLSTTVFTLLFIASSSAQKAQDSIHAKPRTRASGPTEHQVLLKESPYIFEGVVLKQELFPDQSGVSLASTTFQVQKIFKGENSLHVGTINIITTQGDHTHDAGPSIGGVGSRYIILGSQSDSSSLRHKFAKTDNSFSIDLQGLLDIVLTPKNQGLAAINGKFVKVEVSWRSTGGYSPYPTDRVQVYQTRQEFYDYLKENGITLQEEVKETDGGKH